MFLEDDESCSWNGTFIPLAQIEFTHHSLKIDGSCSNDTCERDNTGRSSQSPVCRNITKCMSEP